MYKLQKQLKVELNKQTKELKQKAKKKCLQHGDECNKFFYTKMFLRQHHNILNNYLNEQENVCRHIKHIKEQAISYFTNLYTGESYPWPHINCRKKISSAGATCWQLEFWKGNWRKSSAPFIVTPPLALMAWGQPSSK